MTMLYCFEIYTYFKIIFIYMWTALLAYLIYVFWFTVALSKQTAFATTIHKATCIINLHTLALITSTSS